MKKTLRILIIEDSEEDTLFLVRRLEQSEFAPLWRRVATIESLRAALAEETWDIAFSDHSMPGLGIRDALALVKERGLDLPLIILSGVIKEEDAVALLNAGAQDYILKDNWSRLIPVIERELRAAQVRRERQEIERVQRENQARKNAIVDSALDAIVTIDHEGKIFEWNKGNTKGSIGILMDITERRQLEEQLRQLQKMESVGQLAAEDDPALRRLAARILRTLGYEVLEAASGVEAIAVWEQHGKKVNLLLTDLVMPDGLTGRELAKQMATREAGLKVIYSSGYSPEIRETAFIFREGYNFLQKPYPPAKLAETVRRCLDQK